MHCICWLDQSMSKLNQHKPFLLRSGLYMVFLLPPYMLLVFFFIIITMYCLHVRVLRHFYMWMHISSPLSLLAYTPTPFPPSSPSLLSNSTQTFYLIIHPSLCSNGGLMLSICVYQLWGSKAKACHSLPIHPAHPSHLHFNSFLTKPLSLVPLSPEV